jgi:hypothetical protein
MGQEMSSSSNNVQEKRTGFLEKLEKDAKPEEKDSTPSCSSTASTKPRGTFLEGSSDEPRRAVERRAAPSCARKGG